MQQTCVMSEGMEEMINNRWVVSEGVENITLHLQRDKRILLLIYSYLPNPSQNPFIHDRKIKKKTMMH